MDVARTTDAAEKVQIQSDLNRTTVFLPCPGTFSSRCPYVCRMWTCEQCHRTLKYAFDGYFYCGCGRAPVHSFSFKCCSPVHGQYFKAFSEEDINNLLTKMRSLREINILVIGETGVGKSTWINAFANYLSFSSFEDAEHNKDIVYAIPSWHDFQGKVVFIGTAEEKELAENEHMGESVTQVTVGYVFKYRDLAIRLIDTPGIGDTRGLETDKVNIQNVLDHLAHYDELHGICFVLKSTEARMTDRFKFCVKELLNQLHRDACRNFFFCFSRTRGTDYGPGNTLSILKTILDDLHLPIKLNDDTVYCIDDEGVVYIYGYKNGIVFDPKIRKAKKESWEHSVEVMSRLIDSIMSRDPHKLKYTMSLNEIRRVILALLKGALVDVSSIIQSNIQKLELKRREIEEVKDKSLGSSEQTASVILMEYELVPLTRPQVVCTSGQCKLGLVHCEKQGSYVQLRRQICCEACPAELIKLCDNFRMKNGKCQNCQCDLIFHEFEMYQPRPKPRVMPRRSAVSVGDTTAVLNAVIKQVDDTVAEEEQEQNVILDIASKLAYFLRKNSVSPENDAFEGYLEKAAAVNQEQQVHLSRLLQEYKSYQQNLRALYDCAGSSQELPKTPDDITKLFQELYNLRVNGPKLKKAVVNVVDAATSALAYHVDKVFMPDITSVKKNALQKKIYDFALECRRRSSASSPLKTEFSFGD